MLRCQPFIVATNMKIDRNHFVEGKFNFLCFPLETTSLHLPEQSDRTTNLETPKLGGKQN